MNSLLKSFAALSAPVSLLLLSAQVAQAEITFVDQAGRTVTLEAPAKRLAALPTASALVYFAVDGTAENIAGTPSNFATRTLSGGLYDQTIPELTTLDMTLAGDNFVPNVEAILAAQPDVVYSVVHKEGILDQLEGVGLNVVGWSCCTEEQRRGYLTMSGQIAGKSDRAAMLLGMQDTSNAALAAHFKDTDPASYIRMLEVDKLGEQIQVVANSSQNYALSGIVNLAADDSGEWWRTIDAEQFLVWNPEVIIIPAWANDLTPENFYSNPILASVEAIKNKRVYKVPMFNRSPDAPEVFLTAQWLARITRPQDFADAGPFRDTFAATFKTIYGKDLTPEQIDRLLRVAENTSSVGYTELFQ